MRKTPSHRSVRPRGDGRWRGAGPFFAVVAAATLLPLATADGLSWYSRQGYLDGAERHWRQRVADQPDDPANHQVLAATLVRDRRDPRAALPFAERAVELDPDAGLARLIYARCLWDTGSEAEAREQARAAAVISPDSFACWARWLELPSECRTQDEYALQK